MPNHADNAADSTDHPGRSGPHRPEKRNSAGYLVNASDDRSRVSAMDSGRRETGFPSHLEAYAVVTPSVFLRWAAPAAIILIAENRISEAALVHIPRHLSFEK